MYKNKYRAKKSKYKDFVFASKLEAAYASYLDLLKENGVVDFYLKQVPFHLDIKTKYVCDFMIFYADDYIEFVDVKGYETKDFKVKKAWVEDLYKVEIKIVKKGDF